MREHRWLATLVSDKTDSSWTQKCTPVIPTFGRLRTAVNSTPAWVTTARPGLKKNHKTNETNQTHTYAYIYQAKRCYKRQPKLLFNDKGVNHS